MIEPSPRRRSPPRITVVTPSFNQAPFLEQTILSVLEQSYPDLEYIVLDGGSSDGSAAIIARYAPRLAYWRSEKDGGQAAAINAGFRRATGTLLAWINSDDLLEPGSLAAAAEAHARNPDALVAGHVVNFDDEGRERVRRNFGLTRRNLADGWTRAAFFHQPGVFIPRSAFDHAGWLDETLHYAFDLDWMLRALRSTAVVYLDRPLARFRFHGEQKSSAAILEVREERRAVVSRHLDALDPADVARVRAELELDVSSARLSLPMPDRGGGLRSLASALATYPRALFRPRVAKILGYALAPPGVASRYEEHRRRRIELG